MRPFIIILGLVTLPALADPNSTLNFTVDTGSIPPTPPQYTGTLFYDPSAVPVCDSSYDQDFQATQYNCQVSGFVSSLQIIYGDSQIEVFNPDSSYSWSAFLMGDDHAFGIFPVGGGFSNVLYFDATLDLVGAFLDVAFRTSGEASYGFVVGSVFGLPLNGPSYSYVAPVFNSAIIDGELVERVPEPPPSLAFKIDIRPGSDKNRINPTSDRMISVAVITTDAFDATQVDWESVLFGPEGATESHGRVHVKDVDGDGDMDTLLHFYIRDTGIQCGDTEATLTGQTFGGEFITGSDFIVTVGCD